MTICIDISQLAYPKTGVSNYLENLVLKLVENEQYEYVLFFASLRRELPLSIKKLIGKKNVRIVTKKIPPLALDILWNIFHKAPIEAFVGNVDVFISSDWTEPPTKKAKKATILYDLIVYKYPEETDKKIIKVQTRKLNWVKRESDIVFCISDSTKKDAIEFGFSEDKLRVLYPGLTL